MPILSTKGGASAGGFGGIGKGGGGAGQNYEFTSHTFTSGNGSLQYGPSYASLVSAYSGTSWASDTNIFNVSSGIQRWKAPGDGTYRFEIIGASGGIADGASYGGWPANVTLDYDLVDGQEIAIAVGQRGQVGNGQYNSGGGGGSFVYDWNTNTLIGAAGGGAGSAAHPNPSQYAYTMHASLTESGNPGTDQDQATSSWPPASNIGGTSTDALGGTNGGNGSAGGSYTGSNGCYGAPGGGWNTSSQYRWTGQCGYPRGAVSNGLGRPGNFVGGAGEQSGNTQDGGFGGGGGGSGCCGGQGSGGGGGYSGGAGSAPNCCGSIGGGGGSYSSPSASNVSKTLEQRQQNGTVTVTYLG